MDENAAQKALRVLLRVKGNLLETMVEELIYHEDDDPSSFSLQEIEDKFAIRIANLNTLIATMQDQMNQINTDMPSVISYVGDTTTEKLNSKLNELLNLVSPDEIMHLSVTPDTTNSNKLKIILVYQEYNF